LKDSRQAYFTAGLVSLSGFAHPCRALSGCISGQWKAVFAWARHQDLRLVSHRTSLACGLSLSASRTAVPCIAALSAFSSRLETGIGGFTDPAQGRDLRLD